LKYTVNGAHPDVVEAVKAAVGACPCTNSVNTNNGIARNSLERVFPGFCLKAVLLKGLLIKRN
jgi:hypothetical protein